MFAVLKGHKGLPIALFEITKETPKRYYGKIVDQIGDAGRFLYLPGHHSRLGRETFVDKDIVVCLIPTDRGWRENKDALTATLATFIRNTSTLAKEREVFDHKIMDAQKACLTAAKANVGAILNGYV